MAPTVSRTLLRGARGRSAGPRRAGAVVGGLRVPEEQQAPDGSTEKAQGALPAAQRCHVPGPRLLSPVGAAPGNRVGNSG